MDPIPGNCSRSAASSLPPSQSDGEVSGEGGRGKDMVRAGGCHWIGGTRREGGGMHMFGGEHMIRGVHMVVKLGICMGGLGIDAG